MHYVNDVMAVIGWTMSTFWTIVIVAVARKHRKNKRQTHA